MALQTSQLSMISLGVVNNSPPDSIQPPLAEGIHLRWSFAKERGFPWFGYHLFRRPHLVLNSAGAMAVDPDDIPGKNQDSIHFFDVKYQGQVMQFNQLPAGNLDNYYLETDYGYIISSSNLRIMDVSPPSLPGTVHFDKNKLDLENQSFTKFLFHATPIYDVHLRLRFKSVIPHPSVTVTIKSGERKIHTTTISGEKNQIKVFKFQADHITEIQLSAGSALLYDLFIRAVYARWHQGWKRITTFNYPMALPVAHPDYPCPKKPQDMQQAHQTATGRVQYGTPSFWEAAGFEDLHTLLQTLVEGGPETTMADKSKAYTDESQDEEDAESPKMPHQNAMDILLAGALHPSVAQMLGLYFVDETAEADTAYDYMIMADHTGKMLNAIDSLTIGRSDRPVIDPRRIDPFGDDIDAWISYNIKLEDADHVPHPQQVRAYSLPGMTTRDEETGLLEDLQAVSSVGLTWMDPENHPGAILYPQPIMYLLWRMAFDGNPPQIAPQAEQYELVSPTPLVVADQQDEAFETSSQFPPFRMLMYDNQLANGWYSYRVTAIDIFGRHSPASRPARWFQWEPHPPPLPWYHQPGAGDVMVHSFAVQALDESAPPSPSTGVEAYALDPRDPLVLRDSAFQTWIEGLASAPWYSAMSTSQQQKLIGLRVSWAWSFYQMRQAPDVDAFRIHYAADPFMARQGVIESILPGVNSIVVITDIHEVFAFDHFRGYLVQIGPVSYEVMNSMGNPVRLFIANQGQQVPAGDEYILKKDHTRSENWDTQLIEVDADQHFTETIKPISDRQDNLLEGGAGFVDGNVLTLPAGVDLRYVRPNIEHVELYRPDSDTISILPIVQVDADHQTVILANTPAQPGNPVHWRIGLLCRRYEVFLPNLSGVMQNGVPDFAVSLAQPLNFSYVGVSAVRSKPEAREGIISPPAKIYRVWREKPEPPITVPPDSEKIFASPADYHSRSYFTYRWRRVPHLKTHIYRALDDALFHMDYDSRPKASGEPSFHLDAANPVHAAFFPDEPEWNAVKREFVADEINALNANAINSPNRRQALAAYDQLSNDAMRVLGGLPGNEKAFKRVTNNPLDPDDSAYDNQLGPDNSSDHPLDPDPDVKIYIDNLPGKARNRYFYRAAYIDDVHNASGMSLSSAPVYLPDVSPPPTPAVTKITGGDRLIELKWTARTVTGLARYLVYRSTEKDNVRDIRLMGEPVAELQADADSWADHQLDVGTFYYYRVQAVKQAEYRQQVLQIGSEASRPVAARAYEQMPPAAIEIENVSWAQNPDGIFLELNWATTENDLIRVLHQAGESHQWIAGADWMAADIGTMSLPEYAHYLPHRLKLQTKRQNGRLISESGIVAIEAFEYF